MVGISGPASGQVVTFASALGSSPPSNRVGDTVRVRYQPDQPAEAEIDAFWENWFSTVAAGATGGVLLAVGLGSAIFSGTKISISPPMLGAILVFAGALALGLLGYLYLRRRKQSKSAKSPENMVRAFGLSLWLPGVVLAILGVGSLILGLDYLRIFL